MSQARRGLLLFAHGARDAAWARPFEAVASRCRGLRPGEPVVLGFLEFMTPGLIECGAQLAAQGCTAVDLVPLFLGAGGHVRKDIPLLLAQLSAKFPDVQWRLRPPVGESDVVVQAMAQVAAADESLVPRRRGFGT